MEPQKIKVQSGKVVVHAYGQGGTVMASFVCATEEDARRLQAAIEGLVERDERQSGQGE